MATDIVAQLQALQQNNIARPLNDSVEMVTLYHGTSSIYLNEILAGGIQPRTAHSNRNFSQWENPSNDALVYLSTYLQHWYALVATGNNLDNYETLNHCELTYEEYRKRTRDVPIIIEVEVPKSWLTFDEDVWNYQPFTAQFNENPKQALTDLDWQYSLNQHTCASLRAIPAANIKSVQSVYYEHLESASTAYLAYAKIVMQWRFGLPIPNNAFEAVCEPLTEFGVDLRGISKQA